MTVANADLHRIELAIYSTDDAGRAHVREWLRHQIAKNNEKWPTTLGDELLQMQGEQRAFARLFNLIVNGPKIKE